VTPKECGKKLMRDYHKGGRWDTESYHLADAIAAEIQAAQAEARKQALEEAAQECEDSCDDTHGGDRGTCIDRGLSFGCDCCGMAKVIKALAQEKK